MIAPHVGGGFGSKGAPHAHDVLAALAAMTLPGRAVKFPVTRQQMFVFVGYRPPTASHIRIAANRDGGITALVHDAYSQSSHTKEFVEQTAVPSRSMYTAPHRRTSHRAVALDVPVPYWMRAPGEAPECMRVRSRWTSSPTPVGSIRSSCGSATIRPSTPKAANRGGRAGWSTA